MPVRRCYQRTRYRTRGSLILGRGDRLANAVDTGSKERNQEPNLTMVVDIWGCRTDPSRTHAVYICIGRKGKRNWGF